MSKIKGEDDHAGEHHNMHSPEIDRMPRSLFRARVPHRAFERMEGQRVTDATYGGGWRPGSFGYEAEIALFETEGLSIDLALRPDGLIDVAISTDDDDFIVPEIPPALLAELGHRLVEATSSEVLADRDFVGMDTGTKLQPSREFDPTRDAIASIQPSDIFGQRKKDMIGSDCEREIGKAANACTGLLAENFDR